MSALFLTQNVVDGDLTNQSRNATRLDYSGQQQFNRNNNTNNISNNNNADRDDEGHDSIPVPELSQLHQRPLASGLQNNIHSNNNNNNGSDDVQHNLLDESEFSSAALLLRLGTFRRNARKLYTFFQPQVLEWPSLSVSWMLERKKTQGFQDFSLQSVVVGTQALDVTATNSAAAKAAAAAQTASANPSAAATAAAAAAAVSAATQQESPAFLNYLSCVEFSVPMQIEDVDVMASEDSGDDDNPLHNSDNVAYKQVRGHIRMSQFVGLANDQGAVLKIRRVFDGFGRESVAVRSSKTACVNIFHLSRRDRYAFSTDPNWNAPNLILSPSECPECTNHSNGRPVLPGFGLAVSAAMPGLVVAGGDDGTLVLWDVPDWLVRRSRSADGENNDDDEDDDDDESANDDENNNNNKEIDARNVARKRSSRFNDRPASSRTVSQRENNNNNSNIINGSSIRVGKKERQPSAPVIVPPKAILDTQTGHAINDVSCHATQSHLVVAATSAGDAVLYDLRLPNGKPSGVAVLRHPGGATAAQFHPTAQFQVATGGQDGVVRLWDLRAWKSKSVAAYRYHSGPVQCVAWAPFSDRVFASAGDDGLVCLWDMGRGLESFDGSRNTDGRQAGVPRELAFVHCGHVSPVVDVQWNPSVGEEWTLASVDQGNLLQIWRPNPTSVSAASKLDMFDEDVLDQSQ